MVLNQLDVKGTYSSILANIGTLSTVKVPPSNFITPPIIPPSGRSVPDLHQAYLNTLSANFTPSEVNVLINTFNGQNTNWHTPTTKPPTPLTLTQEQQDKINFYDALNTYFGTMPTLTNLERDWEDLKQWPATFPHETLKDVKDKHDEEKKPSDYDAVKNNLNTWTLTFPSLDASAVKTEYDKPKEIHTDYDAIKKTLKDWTDIFGTETAQQIKDKLDAKPAPSGGRVLTVDEEEAIREYKATKTRLDNAIKNLTSEQTKVAKLQEENANLKAQIGTPAENIIEQELRKVLIAEDWNFTSLLKSLENFLTWRDSQDKDRRKAVYRYWTTINKNIDYLRMRISDRMIEYGE